MAKKRVAFKSDKVHGAGPPSDRWTWLPGDLLASDAWRGRSINCVRLIDALLLDQMAHKGLGNGQLVATYNQLAKSGCTRRLVSTAIHEAEERGLIEVVRHAYREGTESHPSRFRLTFYASRAIDEFGREIWRPATDEWRHYQTDPKRTKKQFLTFTKGTGVVPKKEPA